MAAMIILQSYLDNIYGWNIHHPGDCVKAGII
jgi:hypothetical protein